MTAATAGSPDDDGAAGPSLFAALSEPLDLKLEASKGTVEHLIIDCAELTG